MTPAHGASDSYAATPVCDRTRVLSLRPDGFRLSEHDQKVPQCSTRGRGRARSGRATAASQMPLDELGNEALANIVQPLAFLLNPQREVPHRALAVVQVASGMAAVDQIGVVRLYVPPVQGTDSGTDRAFGSGRRLMLMAISRLWRCQCIRRRQLCKADQIVIAPVDHGVDEDSSGAGHALMHS